jgi:predicted metal-dependent peptidase
MTDPYTPAALAAGRIRLAITRLLGQYPFHARVVERFRLEASEAVATMGVTATANGVRLLFSPSFVLGLPADQFGGALLHEVLHVVLGHLTIDAADYSDQWALTVALEASVNEFVREPLPAGVIRPEDFDLPPMESSPERYRRLERVTRRDAIGAPSAFVDGEPPGQPSVLDDHGLWAEAQEDLNATRAAIDDLIHEAALEGGGLPTELLRAAFPRIGSQAGNGVYVLTAKRQGGLPWQQLLRFYAGQILEPKPSYNRPPRRFPHLVGMVPGHRHSGVRAAVVAIIDTSGSISDDSLEAIDGELARLNRSHPVQVVEADCEVHRVFRYRGRLEQVNGRGGTDFGPALEPSFLRPLRPGLVIYFTDGHGPAPEERPAWPLIWCLLPGGLPPAPWGKVIHMAGANA